MRDAQWPLSWPLPGRFPACRQESAGQQSGRAADPENMEAGPLESAILNLHQSRLAEVMDHAVSRRRDPALSAFPHRKPDKCIASQGLWCFDQI